ncbi:MAG: hypothetical protein R2748_05865 [Bryobacterales bacterium]
MPILLLDLALMVYQELSCRLTGIPRVRRRDHFAFDRAKLRYLTRIQRINCLYCSYANGVSSYFREILARTEQYWCPIKHQREPAAPHSRYSRFLDYGDERGFERLRDAISSDFSDLESEQ